MSYFLVISILALSGGEWIEDELRFPVKSMTACYKAINATTDIHTDTYISKAKCVRADD
jgi:hypothetical protein